ncbi:MAG: translation initiation factor IF-2, partial [Lachnospiraceae bacterium]|nr:translation initiation factor IF-2 [Lachnospiraceae bacterium]
MAKKKVHELAKELNMQSKDICQALSEKGVDVKPQSAITDEDAQYIISRFGQKKDADDVKADAAAKDTVKEDKKDSESVKSEEVKEAESKKAEEDKKAEDAKPKRIITSRGMVRPKGAEGERRKRPDGEKRPKAEGEKRKKPEQIAEPKKKQELTPEEVKAKFDQILGKGSSEPKKEEVKTTAPAEEKKEKNEIPKQIGLKIVAPPEAINKVEGKKKVADDNKSETAKENVNKEVAVKEKKSVSDNDMSRDNRGQRNDRDNRRFGDKSNSDRPRNNDRFQNNGDRPRNNDRFQNNGDRPRNNDRFQKDGDRSRNNDRFQKDGDRQNNFGGDRRNDRRRQDSAPVTEVIQDKDRKSRENKIRQDKQDRNKKNFEDGGRGGKNGRGAQLQHKSMLQKPQKKKEEKKEEIKIISIPEVITIGELAEKMKMQASAIIKKLFMEGKMVTVNSEVDFDSAEEIAMGFDIMCEKEEKVDVIEELLKEDAEDEETKIKRPPVVCVMGHVDHGKTSLLDAIKETNVISQEAGGITQHIGAYMVEINGEKITFLDTPGHEAFTAMRMRGAQSTDIAILVVAADDGVMPQTIEAINHAKAADIEIIVAINKIDKPGANIDRVKQELAEYELLAEDWGGSTIMVPVSAHTREGIDTLLEMVILQSEVLELKANPNRLARGLIIEAKLDKGKGSVATVLVQKGTLHVGDHIAAGSNYGRVRAMVDDKGRQVKEAKPSTPVSILGLNGVPNAGEVLVSTDTGNEARSFAETFIKESREKLLEGTKYRLSLDDLNSQIEAGNLKELNLIIKADVQGSV